MNVFYIDKEPYTAARGLADRHVNKMILEVAQMLSTAVRVRIGDDVADAYGLYRATHRHHPCVVHMLKDPGYLSWVSRWGLRLYVEKLWRTGKSHKSRDVIGCATDVLSRYLYRLHIHEYDTPPQSVPLAMPEEFWPGECRLVSPDDATHAYRRYLRHKYAEWADKGRPAKWTNREAPEWAIGGE